MERPLGSVTFPGARNGRSRCSKEHFESSIFRQKEQEDGAEKTGFRVCRGCAC